MDTTIITLALPSPTATQRHAVKTLFPQWLSLDVARALVFCAVENPVSEKGFFHDIEEYISGYVEDLEQEDEALRVEVEALFANATWCDNCRDAFAAFYRHYMAFLASVFGNAEWEVHDTIDSFSFTGVVFTFSVRLPQQRRLF